MCHIHSLPLAAHRVKCYSITMNEKAIQKDIMEYLKILGQYVVKVQSGGMMHPVTGHFVRLAPAGTPDLFFSLPQENIGQIWIAPIAFCEVKTPTGRLSDAQIWRLRDIHKKKIPWLVADSTMDISYFLDHWKEGWHGKEKHTKDILDESKKFVVEPRPGKRLSSADLFLYNEWADKNKNT